MNEVTVLAAQGYWVEAIESVEKALHKATLYMERHLVECFFNRIRRFRRIALRCEKAANSIKAFVDLAHALARIG